MTTFTRRERQVLRELLHGGSRAQLLDAWVLSPKTIDKHLSNIREKLADQDLELIRVYRIRRRKHDAA